MKRKYLLIYCWFVRILLYFLPDIPIIMRFRGWLYGFGMKKCGRDFQVTHDAYIKDLQGISVGNHCFVGNTVVIMGSGETIIEDEVMIAPHAIIISGNHTSVNGSYRYGKADAGEIFIGKGSWVAGNATLSKGARLPEDSVLSANSFLNKSFDTPHAIYAGAPAKFIKVRDDA